MSYDIFVVRGATASRKGRAIESTFNYGKAFYDFFQIHEIEGLSYEEMRELIVHYAEARKHWITCEPQKPRA